MHDNPYVDILDITSKLDPRLAKAVQDKYEEDRTSFISSVEEATKDKTRRDWAKKGCKKCYGTGIIGRRNNTEVTCRCTNKNYLKFLKQHREEYNKQRDAQK